MNFYNIIMQKYNDSFIDIYVDMDGVVADYEFGHNLDFKNKRPLKTTIKVLERVAKLNNINMYILSICKKDKEIADKNNWLNKNMPFIISKNRIIISKETNPNKSSKELKLEFLQNQIGKNNHLLMLIDDDNTILKYVSQNIKDIILFQDSSLID